MGLVNLLKFVILFPNQTDDDYAMTVEPILAWEVRSSRVLTGSWELVRFLRRNWRVILLKIGSTRLLENWSMDAKGGGG